jgi:hypothetical protein
MKAVVYASGLQEARVRRNGVRQNDYAEAAPNEAFDQPPNCDTDLRFQLAGPESLPVSQERDLKPRRDTLPKGLFRKLSRLQRRQLTANRLDPLRIVLTTALELFMQKWIGIIDEDTTNVEDHRV